MRKYRRHRPPGRAAQTRRRSTPATPFARRTPTRNGLPPTGGAPTTTRNSTHGSRPHRRTIRASPPAAGARAPGHVDGGRRALGNVAASERPSVDPASEVGRQPLLRSRAARGRAVVEQHRHARAVLSPRSVGQGQERRRTRAGRRARQRRRCPRRPTRTPGQRGAHLHRDVAGLRAARHRSRHLATTAANRRSGPPAPERRHRHAARSKPGRNAAAGIRTPDRLDRRKHRA